MSDQFTEFWKQHIELRLKYDYFLMGLAGAIIALAVHRSTGSAWDYSLIIVGLAIVSCGLSIYAGSERQKSLDTILQAYLKLMNLSSSLLPHSPEKYDKAKTSLDEKFEKDNEKIIFLAMWQFRLLAIGAVLFVLWHGLDIYQNSIFEKNKINQTNVLPSSPMVD